jgi:hypothetical protein
VRHRRLVGDQATRAVAQEGLFFSQDEGHRINRLFWSY